MTGIGAQCFLTLAFNTSLAHLCHIILESGPVEPLLYYASGLLPTKVTVGNPLDSELPHPLLTLYLLARDLLFISFTFALSMISSLPRLSYMALRTALQPAL